MIHALIRLIIVVATILLSANIIPGIVVGNISTVFVFALVLGTLNLIVRPFLFLFTLPVTILTFGLFIFILNALMFWLAAAFVPGIEVHGFVPAFLGALLVSIVNWVAHRIFD